ncbi:tRNA pseudouridine(38-40) synthase TruA [Wenyingzhuangia aestuarii]|uniref:tRNA pseudouridine(38-40) synthase TruA n=1 Tax=Wenyingzhuangia aestuarii TaxID=1647582 RepID=UPI00143C56D0|nr:tRNA pseudouridine(38-40) synthase TruA [Wenyingzhuangia aestuarii]NJB81977.1 tRNA pseudouridine38-40 synthase [Wenyingzhuangia aestuarii]
MKYENDSYYLLKLQYLGFRFHGWQKQPNVKTVQGILEKTFQFIFKHNSFKTLASGRTDAMVSANEAYCHLITKTFYNIDWMLLELNKNLPQDIRILAIEEVDLNFDIIQASKIKEYHYLFSHGERNHPFCASLITGKNSVLNIPLMQQAAKLFEGKHNFKKYTKKPSENTVFEREVFHSEITKNTLYTANFFPKESFIYTVKGPGFMHYQIRMMMGILFQLGSGEVDLDFFKKTLSHWNDEIILKEIAPASGLILHKNTFK